MKKISLLTCMGMLIFFSVFSQQIGDGITPEITDYNQTLPSGFYFKGNYVQTYPPGTSLLFGGDFIISGNYPSYNMQLRISDPGIDPNAKGLYYRVAFGSAGQTADWIKVATTSETNLFSKNQIIQARLGIKNTTPAYDLDVAGTGRFTNNVLTNGKMGIKTTNPIYELDVVGTGRFSRNILTSGKIGVNTYDPTYQLDVIGTGRFTNNLFISGKIGVKTPSPMYDLDVNGTIRAKEVRVEIGWADFVFEKDYQLPTLSEVKANIEEHKHLPGMPTAAEVKENGIGLSEATSLLLQKIEELTLYTLQQQEQIEKQNDRINELEQLLNPKY